MATLGNAAGTAKTSWPPGWVQIAGPYLATQDGPISDVKIKVEGGGGGDGKFRALVYISAGAGKIATSDEVTVLSAQAAGEVTCPIHSGSIVNGQSYYVGYETGPGGNIFFYNTTGAVGVSFYVASATYPTAPDPFPGGGPYTDGLWAYVDFTPPGGGGSVSNTGGLRLETLKGLQAVQPAG